MATLSVDLSDEDMDLLRRLAAQEGRSMGAVVVLAIREYVATRAAVVEGYIEESKEWLDADLTSPRGETTGSAQHGNASSR